MDAALTRTFADGLRGLADGSLPVQVAEHASLSVLNVLSTAIGASSSRAVDLVVDHALMTGATGPTPVLGRRERLEPLMAATANGLSAHHDDFDDTHLATVIHPGAASMAAVVSIASRTEVDGTRALTAFALGCEAQLRVGAAMSPEHYDEGWHITGSCAPIGAAVTAGILLGLDTEALTHAIGVAASQTLGQREAFGTMIKPFHAGKGASNGVHAALLAERGFTAPVNGLENPRGFFAVLSPHGSRPDEAVTELGTRWELLENAFKPYPCGVVTHPAIDAAIRLSERVSGPEDLAEVIVHAAPLVVELTGEMDPADGLQARFSTAHGVAVALLDGVVGLAQYADERVVAADVTALRAKVRLEIDPGLRRDESRVEVLFNDGTLDEEYVPHARGSRDRPLTEAELLEKCRTLVEPVLPGSFESLRAAVAQLEGAANLDALLAAATRQEVLG